MINLSFNEHINSINLSIKSFIPLKNILKRKGYKRVMDKLIYEMFLVENAIEQAELEKYINECIMISNNTNTISNIETLNENFSDKVKAELLPLKIIPTCTLSCW